MKPVQTVPHMEISSILLWGLLATTILTTIMAAAKSFGLSRMDIPFLLGTMFTANRNRAPFYGMISHIFVGWFFALLYAAAFEKTGISTWWFGMLLGLIHGNFILSAGLQIISTFHPRMAHPYQGPTPTKQLQPPGPFATNYGNGTPAVTLVAHLIYGCILGLLY